MISILTWIGVDFGFSATDIGWLVTQYKKERLSVKLHYHAILESKYLPWQWAASVRCKDVEKYSLRNRNQSSPISNSTGSQSPLLWKRKLTPHKTKASWNCSKRNIRPCQDLCPSRHLSNWMNVWVFICDFSSRNALMYAWFYLITSVSWLPRPFS